MIRWISRYVIDLFVGYEFPTKDGWISDERWLIYDVCICATEVLLSTTCMAHLWNDFNMFTGWLDGMIYNIYATDILLSTIYGHLPKLP